MTLHFDLPKEQSSIIKVIGVGGGGSNAVNHMYNQGIIGVNFVVCNTDSQALENSPVPNRIQLGPEITKGLGAGSLPEVGRKACEESTQAIKDILNTRTEMVFVTAGMGGGTGTGAAPVVAKIAREMGILTVGIVTTPFSSEGARKLKQAHAGLALLKEHVDTIIVISNDNIREIYGNLKQSEAFAKADNILCIAARSISEIITNPGHVNIDFADVKYVMQNGGVTIMGTGIAYGEDRAYSAVTQALTSPLLNDSEIKGAQKVLINIASSHEHEVTMDEFDEITDHVRVAAGNDIDVIFGTCYNDDLNDGITVTVIATGFEENQHVQKMIAKNHQAKEAEKKIHHLDEPKQEEIKIDLFSNNSFFQQSIEPTIEESKQDDLTTFAHDFTYEDQTENVIEFEVNSYPVNPIHEEDFPEVNEMDFSKFDFKVTRSEEPTAKEEEVPFNFYTAAVKSAETEPKIQLKEEGEDRKKVLRELSFQLNNPNIIKDLENEPAYKRKNVSLNDLPHSSENNLSRFTLKEDEVTGKTHLGKNSFLHDNVD